jgi:hypothetical protein
MKILRLYNFDIERFRSTRASLLDNESLSCISIAFSSFKTLNQFLLFLSELSYNSFDVSCLPANVPYALPETSPRL